MSGRDQLGLDFDVQRGEQKEHEGLSSACAVHCGCSVLCWWPTAIPGSVPALSPPAVPAWLPLHLGTVLSTWGVPLHTKGLQFFWLSQGFFGSFGQEFASLMQAVVLADLQAGSPWQLSLYTKHHMAFGGGGNESSRKVNLCLWCCLSLLSGMCGEVGTWNVGSSWAWPPRGCR